MKDLIKKALLEKVDLELSQIEAAALTTKAYAQDGDLKSDGKYDTRGIEAGYLAGAQMKRLEELKLERQMLEEIPLRAYRTEDQVGIGALVEVKLNNIIRKYFIASTAGGTMLNIENEAILVISVFSPLGDAMIDLKVGEIFELEMNNSIRTYEIVGLS